MFKSTLQVQGTARRIVAMLLALVAFAGIMATSARAASDTTASDTGVFEMNVVGATGFASYNGLKVYMTDGENWNSTISLSGGQAFRILAESGDMWRVQTSDGTIGWVYYASCFINLPDVLPSIIYDISSAYSAMFKSSGYDLSGVTGTVLTGYENLKQYNARLGKEEYLVPMLYSSAKKVAVAQASARANGDTLVIMDAYRPAAAQDAVRSSLKSLMNSNTTVYKGINKGSATWKWFIASGTSNHQRGVAIDVTLTWYGDTADGTYYQMPTAMHELSASALQQSAWHDTTSSTSAATMQSWATAYDKSAYPNTWKLVQYCTNAGLATMSSEWWHFEDKSGMAYTKSLGLSGNFSVSQCLSTPVDVATTADPASSNTGA